MARGGAGSGATASPYRGVDRRYGPERHAAAVRSPLRALLGISAAVLAATSLTLADPDRGVALDDALSLARTALLTGAGVLALVRWRMTGLTRAALTGAALLVLGGFADGVSALAPLAGVAPVGTTVDQLAGLGAGLTAVVLLSWGYAAPAVDAGFHPPALLVALTLAVPLLGAAVLGVDRLGPGLPGWAPPLCGAVLWGLLLVGGTAAREPGRRPDWCTSLALCLLLAALLEGLAIGLGGPAGAAHVLAVAAGVIAVRGTYDDLRASLAAQSRDLLRLTADAHDHTQQQSSAHLQQEERLHEVRNLLAGLHGAASTLRRYEDQLDPGVRRRLEDAVSGELRRLAHLVDPGEVTTPVTVDLPQALASVVTAERSRGVALRVQYEARAALARAPDVATVVAALLANARRHAPGAQVVLSTGDSGGEVLICVEDSGPGVDERHRTAVFERGERAGATATGTGLGLFAAQRLTAEMGGRLWVEGAAGGGARFVLALPAGPPVAGGDVWERGANGPPVVHERRRGLLGRSGWRRRAGDREPDGAGGDQHGSEAELVRSDQSW